MDYPERMGCASEGEERRGLVEQATYWVDTLEDSVRDCDRKKFFEWVKESPQHIEELLMAIAINDSLFDLDYQKHGLSVRCDGKSSVVGLALPAAAPLHSAHKAGTRHRGYFLAAVGMALLLAIAAITLQWIDSGKSARYQTSIGETRRVTLNDGSHVTLNTDSAVVVRIDHRSRRIDLQRGEVDVTVASDPARPLSVTAGGTVVRALGTQFSLRLSSDQRAEIIVSSGRVAIHRAQDNAPLAEMSGNERIVIAGGRIAARERLSMARMMQAYMWQKGRLEFNGETIAEAAAQFNRYNERQLVIADKELSRCQLFGSFQATRLDEFIKTLENFNLAPIASTSEVVVLGSIHSPASRMR